MARGVVWVSAVPRCRLGLHNASGEVAFERLFELRKVLGARDERGAGSKADLIRIERIERGGGAAEGQHSPRADHQPGASKVATEPHQAPNGCYGGLRGG